MTNSTVHQEQREGRPSDADMRTAVQRAIQRALVGMEYISLGDAETGATPKDTLYARGTLKLYHYRPLSDEVYRVPLVLVMSLVTKPYILDLTPGQSLVEFLLRQGFDVYMIDWGIPRREDSRLRLEDYVLDFIPDCVAQVQADSGEEDVSLVGYCMGGLLALLYQALHPESPVKNLACFTTPVDFDGLRLFQVWSQRDFFDVDEIVDTLGNIPPDLLEAAFEMLRPAQRSATQVRLIDNMWNDDFVKANLMIDRWASDHIPFPGECFRQCVKDLSWENKLVKGTLELDGRPVRLQDVTVPVLHVMGQHDHIVPLPSGQPLVQLVGAEDKEEVVLKGGHVSLVAGGNALYRLWPQLERWLAVRSV